jgi:hypothetical protein
VVSNAKEYRGQYEAEIAESVVEEKESHIQGRRDLRSGGEINLSGKRVEDTRKPPDGAAVMAQDGTTNTGTPQAKYP